MKILINYAAKGTNYAHNDPNGGYFNAQKLNSKTALSVAGFDQAIGYRMSDLPSDFAKKHERHFSYTRGAGYWIWKPYIVLDAIQKMSNDDILMYSDSGCHFIHSMQPVFDILEQTPNKVLAFRLSQIEKDWTKRDCFVELGCDKPEFTDSKQIMSTFFLCRKTEFAISIAKQWYEYASDFHMVADDFVSPSIFPNYPSFKEHRHDQSVLSLVCKLNNVTVMEDITEWGNPGVRGTPQIVSHTRRRD